MDTVNAETTSRARVLGLVALTVVIVVAVVCWRVSAQDADAESGTDAGVGEAPYADAQSAGGLTLCSDDGEPVTGGTVDALPFADVVVGETALPSEIDPAGAVGTLFAYQPRQGIGTEEFSGVPLTAANQLTDPGRPAVRVTEDVWSVADFVTAYPATFDGFVQLRLYLGTPEAGTLSDRPYDTADLRVDGDTWELVQGGSASCAAASALVP